MNNWLYILLTISLVLISLLIFDGKGYLSIKNIQVGGRDDISKYLESKYLNNMSFFNLDTSKISNDIKDNYNEVKSVGIKRNLNFGINVKIIEKTPIAFNPSCSCYISNEGYIFMSSKEYAMGDLFDFTPSFNLGSKILSEDAIEFLFLIQKELTIEKINIGNNKTIEVLLEDSPVVIVEDNGNSTDLKSIVEPLLQTIKYNSDIEQIIVLNSRLVIR